MRSTFKILYYINRSKVKADGTTAIMCRITIDGKNSVFATGCYCNPKDWKAKTGEVRDARTNNLLEALRSRIEASYDKLLKDAGMVTAEMLKNEISSVSAVPVTLLKAGEEERERLRIRSEVIKSTSSYRQSKSSQSYLHEYLLSLGMRDIAFEDITEDIGWGYKLYLKSKDCGAGHINHCLTWLNRLIYIAVDREVIRFNPLADVTYEKKPDSKLRHISRAELQRIMEQPMPERLHLFSLHGLVICRCKTALSLAYWNNRGRKTLHPYQQEENRCRVLYTVTPRSRADIVLVQYNR